VIYREGTAPSTVLLLAVVRVHDSFAAVWTLAQTAGHSGVGISAPCVYQDESKRLPVI
jgi:hypothetical protein